MLALCIHSYQHTIHTDVDNVMKTTTYDVRNPGHGLGYVHKCGGIKLVNQTPTFSSLNNCISNSNTDKKKQPCTDSFPLKRNIIYYYKKE